MALVCLIQPPTPPQVAAVTTGAEAANPMMKAFGMLENPSHLIFMLVQLAVSGMMQFYFLGTGQFMQNRGIRGKNVSAAMGMAQAVQAAATILLPVWLIDKGGYAWTFAIGALCWAVLFATYVVSKGSLGVMLIQGFHGLAYVFFIVGGENLSAFVVPQRH